MADLHLWRLGPGHRGLIVSLVSPVPCSADDIKSELRRRHVGLSHVTIEVAVCQDCAPGQNGSRIAADAASGLAEAYAQAIKDDHLGEPERYRAFLGVLERDARDSLAAIQLVLAQNSISSQLIDNLNASIHLRALLTDLFLIDEILKPQKLRHKPATME